MTSISNVLIKPLLTEKASMREADNIYVFMVDLRASKTNIKHALKKYYEVEAVSINTSILKGKNKRHGRFVGKRKDQKKAYIKLAEGQTLPIWGAQ